MVLLRTGDDGEYAARLAGAPVVPVLIALLVTFSAASTAFSASAKSFLYSSIVFLPEGSDTPILASARW